MPYNAVTEVEIWTSNLIHRKLVTSKQSGLLVNDLAERIETKDHKVFHVDLKPLSSSVKYNKSPAEVVKSSFDNSKKMSKDALINQIKKIEIKSKLRLEIVLIEPNTNFVKELSSGIFGVYDLKKPLRESFGHYKYLKGRSVLRKVSDNESLPDEIVFLKTSNFNPEHFKSFLEGKSYDTFLGYLPEKFLESKDRVDYSTQETWGLVMNLSDNKYNTALKRKCLSAKISRKQLVKNILTDHQATESLSGLFKQKQKLNCDKIRHSKIYIPKEIGKTAEKLCIYFKRNQAFNDCKITEFTNVLQSIKDKSFDTALISLTIDGPFESFLLSTLKAESTFNIVGDYNIKIPRALYTASGSTFLKFFEKFVFDNMLFISISLPTRKVMASNKEKYLPSLIGPAFDNLENLSR